MSPAEIMERFVSDKGDLREYLRQPFSQGDYIYATDGHACVRFRKQDGMDAPYSGKPANVAELFDKYRTDNFMSKFPDLPEPEKCPACGGSGIGYKCRDCDGHGEFDHGKHSYICKECDGEGSVPYGQEEDQVPCWNCRGSRYRATPLRVSRLQHFDIVLLSKLKDLPGIRFAPSPTREEDAAYFVFDGGEGLLMPIRA